MQFSCTVIVLHCACVRTHRTVPVSWGGVLRAPCCRSWRTDSVWTERKWTASGCSPSQWRTCRRRRGSASGATCTSAESCTNSYRTWVSKTAPPLPPGLEECLVTPLNSMYTRLQTVWSLPGHSRQANKDHSPRCHRRPNGHGRLADKVVQPTTQSAEGCTLYTVQSPRVQIISYLPEVIGEKCVWNVFFQVTLRKQTFEIKVYFLGYYSATW